MALLGAAQFASLAFVVRLSVTMKFCCQRR
jgi:hypothetical protein